MSVDVAVRQKLVDLDGRAMPENKFLAEVLADHLRRFKVAWYVFPEYLDAMEKKGWLCRTGLTISGKHWLEKYGFLEDGTCLV